jgi:hypothetical protein
MAAQETLRVFTRARELLDDGASVTEQMTVLYGLWGVRYVRAEHAEAHDAAQQCLDLAETRRRRPDSPLEDAGFELLVPQLTQLGGINARRNGEAYPSCLFSTRTA